MTNKWEKTVLVAGIRNTQANFMDRLRKMFLQVTHQLDETSQSTPFRRDCAIIATDNISHDHWRRVKDFYKGNNLPYFEAPSGWASIKEEFEDFIFGPGTLRLLRTPSDYVNDKSNPLTDRLKFYWCCARFSDKGQTIKISHYLENFAYVASLDLEKSRTLLGGCVSNGKKIGFIEESQRGYFRWLGLPHSYRNQLQAAGLPFDDEWFIDTNAPAVEKRIEAPIPLPDVYEVQAAPVKSEPTVLLKDINDQHTASMDLLLEAMATQQRQVEDLKSFMEQAIPKLIQSEIRGITKLLGSLVPQLQGLNPEEIDQVQKMLDLFLGMRKMRSPDSDLRN